MVVATKTPYVATISSFNDGFLTIEEFGIHKYSTKIWIPRRILNRHYSFPQWLKTIMKSTISTRFFLFTLVVDLPKYWENEVAALINFRVISKKPKWIKSKRKKQRKGLLGKNLTRIKFWQKTNRRFNSFRSEWWSNIADKDFSEDKSLEANNALSLHLTLHLKLKFFISVFIFFWKVNKNYN